MRSAKKKIKKKDKVETRARKKRHDWNVIKFYFIGNEVATLDETADYFKVHRGYLRTKAAKDKWKDKKDKYLAAIEQKTTDKLIRKSSDEIAALINSANERHEKDWKLFQQTVKLKLQKGFVVDEETGKTVGISLSPGEIKSLTDALNIAIAGEREILGLTKKPEFSPTYNFWTQLNQQNNIQNTQNNQFNIRSDKFKGMSTEEKIKAAVEALKRGLGKGKGQ